MRSADGNARYNMLVVLSVFSCLSGSNTTEQPKGSYKAKVGLPGAHHRLCQQGAVHSPADFTMNVQALKTPVASTGLNGGIYMPATPVHGDVISAHNRLPPWLEVSRFADIARLHVQIVRTLYKIVMPWPVTGKCP